MTHRPEAATTRRTWLGTAGLACWSLAATMIWPRAGHAASPSFHDHFSGMRLLDQRGRTMRLGGLHGKLVLFNFIFTACSTACPVQTQALAQLQRQLAPGLRARVHLVSVSLDPLSDTPQTLAAYARRFQVDFGNWSFVTGRPEDIERLAEALRLFREGKDKRSLDDHSTSLWLVDAQGVLRTRYAGNPPDVPRLARELAALDALAGPSRPR